jgi:hypothetical protein
MNPPRRIALITTIATLASTFAVATPVGAAIDRATMALESSYVLKASLDFGAGTVAVAESITIRNISGSSISKVNLSVMPRAFGELTSISRFSVDSRSVSARWTNNSNLQVQLGKVLAVGASAALRLRFAVRASATIGTSLEGRLSKANGIMQVSHWFPILSDGHATRYPGDGQYTRSAKRIRLELTTNSSSLAVAAPGTLISRTSRYHVYEIRNARDFAFGVSPYYKVATVSAAGARVSVYYTTGNGPSALNSAVATLTTFAARFGSYQWGRFVVAQSGRAGSGNEYPGIVFLGRTQFTEREVIAHETAHQWWYGMAGNDQLNDPWLDEGIAEFSANYFFGRIRSYTSVRPVNSSIYEFPNIPAPLTSTQPDSYNQTVYRKAAAFLDQLRVQMGNADFFAGLRAFFASNRNGIMTSREFRETMAAHGASRDLMARFLRL